MDVQRGGISADSPGDDGGGDEHSGSLSGVRPAPGHGEQDAGLLGPAGLPAADPTPEAQPFDKLRTIPSPASSTVSWMMITAFRRSSATPPSASTSVSGTSTASMAGTPSSRTTSGSIDARHGRCSYRCPTRRATPSATSAGPGGHRGVQRKAHCFVKTYPAETTEAFLDGHVSAFAFLGECPGASCTTTRSWRWPRYWGTAADSAPAPSLSSSPTTCSTTVSGVPARATTRGRWRAWWATPGGISWCPSRPSRALTRSMPTWSDAAWSGPAQGPRGDHRPADGAGPGGPAGSAWCSL